MSLVIGCLKITIFASYTHLEAEVYMGELIAHPISINVCKYTLVHLCLPKDLN